ncbi:AimR family lysis-lysogeny pheromone receptor [Lentibacillus sp. CBA3610]|uniref:AimR family lysis-lysogeny pheromone receptor n=1 Tax=Lentibacillus sp. CBA3610 TaxID=2518176 RepID=UPI001594E87F|nr:AimR family lysis-lysogeny pheromone receptor [Lentibacillus sp. CBA3610]QKY70464.1 hypothetical protein Len3610_13455 [Lentibacillus sp. CBA3610]
MQNFEVKEDTDAFESLPNRDPLTLEQVLLVLQQEHDEATVQQLIRKFCLETTSEDIRKKGMEFLYMNGHYDDLQQLININKASEKFSNQQWADVYQMTLDRKQARYSDHVILKRVEGLKTEEPELKCLLEFIKVSIYFARNEYGKLGNIMEKQQYLFDKINDGFLLDFFYDRLYHNLFVYFLVRNELIIARKYAFRVLTRTKNPKTKINLHMSLGLSYMYDTYFQSMYHLTEALKIAREESLHKVVDIIEQRNIPFLSAHFNKVEGITSTDKSEQAHIEIAKGNYAKAKAILNEIEINSPFRMYYLGMATQDKSLLIQSYNYFIEKRSDYFFSRLPLNALQKMRE